MHARRNTIPLWPAAIGGRPIRRAGNLRGLRGARMAACEDNRI